MIECSWCGKWVHASCEGLTDEGYQMLSALSASIEFVCCKCMPHDRPWRKILKEHLKSRLQHLLKLLAKNKKACALLKLTPHKNTPITSKPFGMILPHAIRKLCFDSVEGSLQHTIETEVYRNTARIPRSIPVCNKSEIPFFSKICHCSSLLRNVEIDKDDTPHTSHKVVNLQEPLMQNKEICFSTGRHCIKKEFETSCVDVHDNDSAMRKSEDATSMFQTTFNVDKFETISSDDDEPAAVFSHTQTHCEQHQSPPSVRQEIPCTDLVTEDLSRTVSLSLLAIKKKVYCEEYVSLKDFNNDMKEVIDRTSSLDLQKIYKDLFLDTFPWFDCENNCLQPNLEVESDNEDSESVKDVAIKNNKGIKIALLSVDPSLHQIVPKIESEGQKVYEDLLKFYSVSDFRTCLLCRSIGDGLPCLEGRLLYCGLNDWIHANCALWSAEVFEEIDGSLQNVHSAVSRGKLIKCAVCEVKGASVGCCAKNCSETYHYPCARKKECAFLDDKRVFCPAHVTDIPLKCIQKDSDFELTRPMYVELDKKKKRYCEIGKVQFLLGSLTVQSLGKIVSSVSDFEDFLIPVDFVCSRLFWSCKKPSKIVKYTIKTKLILSEPMPGFDFGVNITVDHSIDLQVVNRLMAEIKLWHKNVESSSCKNSFLFKTDKMPINLGKSFSLEDFAIQQVVEYLLDYTCKQEILPYEEEPQSTADLLPPELKDAIFEDLNHDLLDGISMQDIFPNPYEDLVSDIKGGLYNAINQSDEKSNEKTASVDELCNVRLESAGKELKRIKSDMFSQSHFLKTFSTGRGQQRTTILTPNNKLNPAPSLKICKLSCLSTVTGKLSPSQKLSLIDNPPEGIKAEESEKTSMDTSIICGQSPAPVVSICTTSKGKHETRNEETHKHEGYYTDVIDFYTHMQCSPISQLDGTADWSGSESTCSSRTNSPLDNGTDFDPIQQLDGAEENHLGAENTERSQAYQFVYSASETESTYSISIAGNSIINQPDLVMRPLDEIYLSQDDIEQPVQCDRCQCTYRNKDSYDRHIPSCDMISTSESESENPKSPENKTLTTLQNVFLGAFAQPMLVNTGVNTHIHNNIKYEAVSEKRKSVNTRQITINGTIVETASPSLSNVMATTMTEQMKSNDFLFDQKKSINVPVSESQQFSPHIVVTPQLLTQPKNSTSCLPKIMASQIISQPGILPFNICVKSGNGNTVQQIQGGPDMTQMLTSSGGIQVINSNSNQVLTISSNQEENVTPIINLKKHVTNFPNLDITSTTVLPVNSIQGGPKASIIQNVPTIRSQIHGGPTVVMPDMASKGLASASSQQKQQFILPAPQKLSKKQSTSVQPKPLLQAANQGRSRSTPKSASIKRQKKLEKTFNTTISQTPLGAGNTVIQLQTNNQTGQPSVMIQPVTSHNLMSAYVEALTQQQNQNMQFIATLASQGDFKVGPQFISQGGFVPQTFHIQQMESGGLVAVPSSGIPVMLPQCNLSILPHTMQQGATILPQGALQQGILSQGAICSTILPQAFHVQNGTTIMPSGTFQGMVHGNISSQTATLLSNSVLQTAGATIVTQNGIGNGQTSVISNSAMSSQENTLISSTAGPIILPQGTLLPQFCNDQVILGSTPTLEMVADSSGCMYLTTTQPVYYGLETIIQNTVMSSQQFVSTALQGVLAQNSSFSATTTQVFQASKIEPVVEVPTGYMVVSNVGASVSGQSSTSSLITAHSMQSSPQSCKNSKTVIPNLMLQHLQDNSTNSNTQRKAQKLNAALVAMGSQLNSCIMTQARPGYITSRIKNTTTLSDMSQTIHRSNISKADYVSMAPGVTLVSSVGQPMMSISQSLPSAGSPFALQSIPFSHPVISDAITQPLSKPSNIKVENFLEICSSQKNMSESLSFPKSSITQGTKSPIPWKHMHTLNQNANIETKTQNTVSKASTFITPSINVESNIPMRQKTKNELEKPNQNIVLMSNDSQMPGLSLHSPQFQTSKTASHHSSIHSSPNNFIQITAANVYPPSSMHSKWDADTQKTSIQKMSKINALSGTETNLNELMEPHPRFQNENIFLTVGTNDNRRETISNQINLVKPSICQVSRTPESESHCTIRSLKERCQNTISMANNHLCSIAKNTSPIQVSDSKEKFGINCQKISVSTESGKALNNVKQKLQHEADCCLLSPVNTSRVVSRESTSYSTPNIMNGGTQYSHQSENNKQPQQINQGTSHFFLNHGSPTSMCSSPNKPSGNSNVLSLRSDHNFSRDIDICRVHMKQSVSNCNSVQHRLTMSDITQINAAHEYTGHEIDYCGSMDNIQSGQSRNIQQIHNHMNTKRSAQMDNILRLNQPMTIRNRQMENINDHHQHQMSDVGHIQNHRPHLDTSGTELHQQVNIEIHNRTQIGKSMHIHNVSSTSMEKTSHMSTNTMHGNKHITINLESARSPTTNSRNTPLMHHQVYNTNNIISIPNNHQSITNQLMHIPVIKNDIRNSCDNICINNIQYTNSQSAFEMCTNLKRNNINMNTGDSFHNINMNNINMHNNMISSNIYEANSQNNLAGYNMLSSYTDVSENSDMIRNLNNVTMSNTQPNTNINQIMNSELSNAVQTKNNSCSLYHNDSSQIPTATIQNDRINIFGNGAAFFSRRSKESKMNLTMGNCHSSVCAGDNILSNENQNHGISVSNKIFYTQINARSNRVVNLPEKNRLNNGDLGNTIHPHLPKNNDIKGIANDSNNVPETFLSQKKPDDSNAIISESFQVIKNSAPMNMKVNSSNNTASITVQNNPAEPSSVSKTTSERSFALKTGSHLIQNHNRTAKIICMPKQNVTINLPTQNSSSITLPQQSGIPTNVVNPMSMRPMNRVLPLHRDSHQKSTKSPTTSTKANAAPWSRQVVRDMPDLNIRDEIINTDLEKAFADSKQIMELVKPERQKENDNLSLGMRSSSGIHSADTSDAFVNTDILKSELYSSITPKTLALPSLPSLNAEVTERELAKINLEKNPYRITAHNKPSSPHTKLSHAYINNELARKTCKLANGQENKPILSRKPQEAPKDDTPRLIYEVTSEDGFNYMSSSLTDLWKKVLEAVQSARKQSGIPQIQYSLPSSSGAHLLGVRNNALRYLIEQLPGARRCTKYKSHLGRPLIGLDNDLDLSEGFKESLWGSARTGPIATKRNHDMFSWMASPYRKEPPSCSGQESDSSISRRLTTLPPAMRFRHLKETSKVSVGVYKSHIHGQGLFCKRDIEEGDMVIEYAGEVIRAVLADQREKQYESMSGRRGVGGCYMFRIDDHLVVDATLKGNAARFINHSCDPNCYSRVVDIHGHKHILIFALRRINIGEELTYDYKFPFEDVKIPCTCGAKKCRKYLN